MKCRFSLSYRDLEEMMNIRGAKIDHATLQRWVMRFVPLIDKAVRNLKKPIGSSWRIDEGKIASIQGTQCKISDDQLIYIAPNVMSQDDKTGSLSLLLSEVINNLSKAHLFALKGSARHPETDSSYEMIA